MLRMAGLTLLFLVGIVGPAQADDVRGSVDRSAVAADQGATTVAMRAPAQVTGALGTMQGTLRAGSLASFRHEVVDRTASRAALQPNRRERQNSVVLPWFSHGISSLAVPVTKRFLVGLGYRHVRGEDLWHEFAEAGALDYDSHRVLVRAQWRF